LQAHSFKKDALLEVFPSLWTKTIKVHPNFNMPCCSITKGNDKTPPKLQQEKMLSKHIK
jgi:hypothetical protein